MLYRETYIPTEIFTREAAFNTENAVGTTLNGFILENFNKLQINTSEKLKVFKNGQMAEAIMARERLMHHNIDKIKSHYGIIEHPEQEKESNLDKN